MIFFLESSGSEIKSSNSTVKSSNNHQVFLFAIFAVVTLIAGVFIGATFFQKQTATGLVTAVQGQATANNLLSKDEIAGKTIKYLNDNFLTSQNAEAKLTAIEDYSQDLYTVSFDIYKDSSKLSEGTVYCTKDGENVVLGNVLKLSEPIPQQPATVEQPQAEVQKADKATGELYIFSYCPAGTAALDSFAKAAKVLQNIADLKVKFFSNMHGEHEKQQNMIQECIQQVAKDKYWNYASQYVEKIYTVCGPTGDITCNKTESEKLMASVGIDSNAVFKCVAENGTALYESDQKDATELSLQYSPSIVVNGVYLGNSADRSPEGIKNSICEGFKTAPKECSQSISNTATAASGNCGS